MPKLLQSIPEGPLAIIGDIHGEIDALDRLLARIDATPGGRDRKLVFVGDFIDRGPDSVAVVQRVADLVEQGRAVAVLGNHELNVLLGHEKEGNGWYLGHDDHAQVVGHPSFPFPSRAATAAEQKFVHDFLQTLPLAREREDLRVVHAAWREGALAELPESGDVAELSHGAEVASKKKLLHVTPLADQERAEFAGLKDQTSKPTRYLHHVAREDAELQSGNPVKLVTSGGEVAIHESESPFFSGGKWRFVRRHSWWQEPVDRHTVVGHYWRRRGEAIPGKDDRWKGIPAYAWSGKVFCVDYSVGKRFEERVRGAREQFNGGLGALLWPERVVVFDDREETIPAQEVIPVAGGG
jgi:predicted MPP superfamily phosphohydrolase